MDGLIDRIKSTCRTGRMNLERLRSILKRLVAIAEFRRLLIKGKQTTTTTTRASIVTDTPFNYDTSPDYINFPQSTTPKVFIPGPRYDTTPGGPRYGTTPRVLIPGPRYDTTPRVNVPGPRYDTTPRIPIPGPGFGTTPRVNVQGHTTPRIPIPGPGFDTTPGNPYASDTTENYGGMGGGMVVTPRPSQKTCPYGQQLTEGRSTFLSS